MRHASRCFLRNKSLRNQGQTALPSVQRHQRTFMNLYRFIANFSQDMKVAKKLSSGIADLVVIGVPIAL